HILVKIFYYCIPSVLDPCRQTFKNTGKCISDLSQSSLELCIHIREIPDQIADLRHKPADPKVQRQYNAGQHQYDDKGSPQIFHDLQTFLKPVDKRRRDSRNDPPYDKRHEKPQQIPSYDHKCGSGKETEQQPQRHLPVWTIILHPVPPRLFQNILSRSVPRSHPVPVLSLMKTGSLLSPG